MRDLPETKFEVDENPEEGYSLQSSPEPKKEPLPYGVEEVLKKASVSEPSAERPFQFSLADLFALTTGVAVFMSLLSMIPAGIGLHSLAGIAGLGALISLILLSVWPPEQPLLRLGWWTLFVLYLLACIGAIVFGR
jgi:hypothetical protein